MLPKVLRLPNMAIAVLLALLLSACQTQLAPPFDQSLVDDLIKADKNTLILFSAVSGGSDAGEFSKFDSSYNDLIGTFGSLQNRAKARPTPTYSKKVADQLAKFEILRDICGGAQGDPGSCVNSSPGVLKKIVENLSKMRDIHKIQGLKKDIVNLFKGNYEIAINQALTVEAALKRAQ